MLREYGGDAVQVESLEALRDYLQDGARGGRWRVAYANEQLEVEIEALCVAARALGDCLLVLEEADLFCSPNFIPGELWKLIQYGRPRPGRRGVHLLATSRSPADVHRSLTRQAYEVYCFTTQEPRDLEYLSKYVGADFASRLTALPPLRYCYQNLWDRTQAIEEKTLQLPPATRRNLPAGVV